MSPQRRFARASFAIVSGLGLARLLVACAAGEPNAPPGATAEPQADAAIIPVPEAEAPEAKCAADTLCAVALPTSTPVSLNGVWGSGPNDVWIVGSPDTLIHWDGSALSTTTAGTKHTFFGVWGSGANDVWTYSTGDAVWHTNGFHDGNAGWSSLATDPPTSPTWTGTVRAMWGTSASDVWAVGPWLDNVSQPTVWHSDGWHDGALAWVAAPMTDNRPDLPGSFSFNAIWGDANSKLWIVGSGGKTRYSDGWKAESTTFTPINSGTSLDLHAVWGAGHEEIWAGGAGGVMRRFVEQEDGSYLASPVDFPSVATIRALYGFGPHDIWAAGAGGMLAHYDGKAWSLVEAKVPDAGPNDLYAIWGSSPSDLWVVGQNTLLHLGNSALPGTSP